VDHHVVVEELRWPGAVGVDAADGAGDEEDVLGSIRPEPVADGRLVTEVELLAAGGEDVGVAGGPQRSDDGGADESTVSRDHDPCFEGERRHAETIRRESASFLSVRTRSDPGSC
jgi:hypothetical protein